MICIPITSMTHDEALEEIKESLPLADVIELRMDLIRDGKLDELISCCRSGRYPVKILVTDRTEGSPAYEQIIPNEKSAVLGHTPFCAPFTQTEDKSISKKQRTALLKEALNLGVDYLDVELSTDEETKKILLDMVYKKGSRTRLIVSHHDFSETPSTERLKEIFHKCVLYAASGVIKIVTFARHADDNLRTLGLIPYAREKNQDIIAFCMGDAGKVSREIAPMLGSFMSFAALKSGAESAHGQFTADEMRQILLDNKQEARGVKISSPGAKDLAPTIFAIFGNPVAHSLSPLMHNRTYKKMGIWGKYFPFCVNNLASAIEGIKSIGIRGVSVTVPFKENIVAYMDYIDDDALSIGAVNTIVNENGKLIGHNTDWIGLVRSIEALLEIKGKVFAVLGAGGTAKAAVFGILKKGGIPVVINRSLEKGKLLASKWGCSFFSIEDIKKIKASCLINTTTVGMSPDVENSPIDPEILSNFEYVADVIYNPLETKLLKDAQKLGCKTISGLDMFIHQGAEQIRLWTGQEPPRMFMHQVVLEKLRESEK